MMSAQRAPPAKRRILWSDSAVTATRSFPHLGTQQSPIDLVDPFAADLRVSIVWDSLLVKPKDDGFSPTRKLVAEQTKPSGVLRVDGERYIPIDVHWHFPSEHHLGGKSFKAEVHIVHIHKDDLYVAKRGPTQPPLLDWARLAVVGVFIKQGRQPYAPMTAATKKKTSTTLTRADLIPEDSQAIRYAGSLTTPPYSENVTFIIFEKPMTATKAQLDPKGSKNNRAHQDVNRRYCVIGDVGHR